MCGIAGFVQRQPPPDGLIERMTGCLAHRGPDGSGVWTASRGPWHIALGHRRLAILDIAGGAQPMLGPAGSVITYNGEVFNHAALRRDLEKRAHTFRTRSDTEVILHQLEEHERDPGPALASLDGMFALALWDDRRSRLLLARDRAGIKPLYYAPLPGGGLAFASELTSLLQHPLLPRGLDAAALASYFFMDYAHAPSAIIAGVRKLEPASFLAWQITDQISALESRISNLESRRYWSPPAPLSPLSRSRASLAAELRESLSTAVAEQLIADVPVGVFLSGGLDSSLVAALARRHHAGPLKTFTISLDDPSFDQSSYARTVAQQLGTEHIEQPLTEANLLESLDAALDSLDEPLADPSLIPTHALSAVAAAHVKVVLGGDGADELWAGYPTCQAHRLAAIYRHIPGPLRRGIIEPLIRRIPVRHGYQSLEWKARRFALRWDDRARPRHLRWMSTLDLPDLARALGDAPAAFPAPFEGVLAEPALADALSDILRLDFETYMPGAVLAKVDRASMAHGLEVRPPMLANRMLDLAFSIPSRLKMRGLTTKALLKDAAAPLLPREIIHRRKMGFAIPLARWLGPAGPLHDRLHTVLHESPLWATGLLRPAPFNAWAAEHNARRADRSRALWALLVLDHWVRRTKSPQGRSPAAPAGATASPAVRAASRVG